MAKISEKLQPDVCGVEPSRVRTSWPVLIKTSIATGAVIAGITLCAAPVVVPAVVTTLGFQSTGITAGSWAAGYMASYGGMVSAGSACATLQAIGATGTFAGAGLTAATGAAVTGSGVVLGAGTSSVAHGAIVVGHYTGQGVKTVSGAVGNAAVVSTRAVCGAAVSSAQGIGRVAWAGSSAALHGTVGLFRHFHK